MRRALWFGERNDGFDDKCRRGANTILQIFCGGNMGFVEDTAAVSCSLVPMACMGAG